MELPFNPPPETGGAWLSLHHCPYSGREDISPWFNQFAGLSSDKIKERLQLDGGTYATQP